MAKTIGTGSQFAIASTYAASAAFSSISNAAEAIASFASDPSLVANDIVQITSGWGLLDQRVARVKTVSGAGPYLVTLEDINTSDTNLYPAGTGAGSVRKITAWAQITQVRTNEPSGGEQNFTDASTIDDVDDKELPTSRSAVRLRLTVYDDPALAWYATVLAAEASLAATGVRITPKNGAKIYGSAIWTMAPMPNIARNEVMTTTVDIALQARITRYAS